MKWHDHPPAYKAYARKMGFVDTGVANPYCDLPRCIWVGLLFDNLPPGVLEDWWFAMLEVV